MWQTTTDIILIKSEDAFDDNFSMDGPSVEAPDEYYEEEYASMLQSEAEMVRISGSGTASPTVGDSDCATPDTDRSFTSLSSSTRQYLKQYRAAKTISAVVKSHLELLPQSLTADNTKIICMALKEMGIYDDVKNEMNSDKTTIDSNVNKARLSMELTVKEESLGFLSQRSHMLHKHESAGRTES